MDQDSEGIAGNVYNKYETRNPVARWMVSNFSRTVLGMIRGLGVRNVLDVGCGEGYFSRQLAREGYQVKALDISKEIIEVARSMTPPGSVTYEARGVSDLDPAVDRTELVACLEVMEHVRNPAQALEKVASVANPYLILSVPNEPLWRLMNIVRGFYLPSLGNTPGHLNHWSPAAFRKFVGSRVRILEVRHPLPWTVILARI